MSETDTKPKNLILSKTAGFDKHGQGIIYEEISGDAIALVYNAERDGNLLTNAPKLLKALKECVTEDGAVALAKGKKENLIRRIEEINRIAQRAIDEAKSNG
jgi:hypothetical protein